LARVLGSLRANSSFSRRFSSQGLPGRRRQRDSPAILEKKEGGLGLEDERGGRKQRGEGGVAAEGSGDLRLLRRRSRQARDGGKWWPEERLGALWVFSGRVRGSGVRGGVVERAFI
jgi:hypothetical protein